MIRTIFVTISKQLLIASLLILIATAHVWALQKTYFVAQDGNDSNAGDAVTSPFKTIGKALSEVYGGKYGPEDAVTIRILNGTYSAQGARIAVGKSIPSVKIIGELSDGKRPVFTNGSRHQVWLILHAKDGQKLKLSIENLEITKYFSVLAVVGDRDSQSKGSEGILIKNNIFRSIGSRPGNSKDRISFGAIRMINSSKNRILNNQFIDIRNSTGCSAIHAIYLAHFSSNNEIRNNIFDGTCGASIKLRDRASNNVIADNKFINLEKVSAVQEWFCDKGARKACKKAAGECPSVNNTVRDNQYPTADKYLYLEVAGRNISRSWCNSDLYSRSRILAQ